MDNNNSNNTILSEIFEQILHISKGECKIDLDTLSSEKFSEIERNILVGLKLLHEDIELYKAEYRKNIDAEYAIKMLQSKNEQLEQFNYMASHDLKEPIRTIKNYTELLEDRIENLDISTQKEFLSIISDSSQRMHDLIEGLLAFTTAGETINKQSVNVHYILDEVKKDLHSLITNQQINIHSNALPVIKADPIALKLILQNLISNAIKFRSFDRDLNINISHKVKDNYHEFSVSDNGLGIKAEYQSKIFELLKRLHSKSKIEGSGVGLTICKKLVELHGGKIWVESEYNAGSTFYFTLLDSRN